MKSQILKVLVAFVMIALAGGESSNLFSLPQQDEGNRERKASAARLAEASPSLVRTTAPSKAKNSFGQLPLYFEKNQGQTDSHVRFLARGGGYTLFLTPTEAVFSLRQAKDSQVQGTRKAKIAAIRRRPRQVGKSMALRMKLSGTSSGPRLEGTNQLPGVVNYLIGKNPSNWHTSIPTFSSVNVRDIYPGIDMVYYGNQRQLEYDFVVKPGADLSKIAFDFEGADRVSLNDTGELGIDLKAGRVTIHRPVIYQLENGMKKPVAGTFMMRSAQRVGFEVNGYDPKKPLVIDPVLVFSTYLGGSDFDEANGIAVDSSGSAYIAGDTSSVDFPTTGTSLAAAPSGTSIGFVSKLDSAGTGLVYSTYLGGTNGDLATAIAVDANGQAYVTGLTSSPDFPVTSASAFQSVYGTGATFNAFLAKLSSDGQSLAYCTYLGGSADDEGTSVAVDALQNAFLTGYASSSNFPITVGNAFQTTLNSPNGNAFVARIDTTQTGAGSLIYSTFLGGSSPISGAQQSSGGFGGDAGLGIAVDANDNVYVTGEASSTDFPITSGSAYQTVGNVNNSAFLTELNTAQSGPSSMVYSTFLGGTGARGDLGSGIALDPSGNVYLTGFAFSSDFPTTTGSGNSSSGKAFVAKFNTRSSGAGSLNYSTLVGGTGGEEGFAIAVDANGDASIGGSTGSADFPVTPGAVQSTNTNPLDTGFIATLSPDGSRLLYGTYFGGSGGSNLSDAIFCLAEDATGNLYFGGVTGSSNIPTTSGAVQASLSGFADAFVAKLSAIAATPQISSVFTTFGTAGTLVTITGSSFGATQGQSTVTFNGVTADVSSWSDDTITVFVPNGVTIGSATVVVHENFGASNGEPFTVTSPLYINPVKITLLVGQSRAIQVLDPNGALLNNATWEVNNPSVVEIIPPGNPGDPTTVQANVAGTATLSALVGTQSGTAQITVLPAGASFPIGTVQWEIPSLGFKISKSVQALRVDDTTPDIYVEDDGPGAIRALTSDGLQKWIWPAGPSDKFPLLAAADDQGGAIYFASQDTPNQFDSFCYFGRVDENGNESWQYQETNCSEDYAIGPDGTIYLLEDNFQNTNNVLTALDPTTGAIKFTVPLPGFDQSGGQNFTMMPVPGQQGTNIPYCTPGATAPITTSNNNNAQAFEHGTMSISSDGTLYIPLSGITTVLDGQPCDSSPDPNNPGYTHPVNASVASWMATANLYLMTVQPDGSYSIQTIDSRTNQGTNWNSATATQFNPFLQRPIPDGQGGVFLPLEQAVYHLSSSGNAKISLPITVSHNDLLISEDGTAYVSGASSTSSGRDDTLLAIAAGSIKWTASPGGAPTATHVLAGGSVAFQNELSDFSQHLTLADPTGAASPLFANPDGSDAGPISRASEPPSYWTLGTWFTAGGSGGLDAIAGSNVSLSGSPYTEAQGNRQSAHAPQNLVTATFMPTLPGSMGTHPWGIEPEASNNILAQIKTVAKSAPFYAITQQPIATADAFIAENGTQPMDVLGFIGHADLVNCNGPSCPFSEGLIFVDTYLIRTPNCDESLLGLCYYYDDKSSLPTQPPCLQGQGLAPNGMCYSSLVPPCLPGDVQILSFCFVFPTVGNQLPARLRDVLLSSTKVAFIATCQTTNVFTDWWDLKLNAGPGGRALVVPDIAAMAQLPVNQQQVPPQNQGFVDLVQGAVAYEAFVRAFGAGKTANQAKDAANKAVADLYPMLIYPPLAPDGTGGALPQVVYKVVGNSEICVNCVVAP